MTYQIPQTKSASSQFLPKGSQLEQHTTVHRWSDQAFIASWTMMMYMFLIVKIGVMKKRVLPFGSSYINMSLKTSAFNYNFIEHKI